MTWITRAGIRSAAAGTGRGIALAALVTGVVAGSNAPAGAAAPARGKAAGGEYVAVVAQGRERVLRVVSRKTGAVLRTVATSRVRADGLEPFASVDLAPDGSVYAVARDTRLQGPSMYQWTLMRYDGRRSTRVLPYASSAVAAPDGRTLAVTVISPDGDGDGRGTEAVRVVTPAGKLVRTLTSSTFPVNKEGWAMYEVGGIGIRAWLNARELVVRSGCCGDSNVSIVSATRPAKTTTWPTFDGEEVTAPLGSKGGTSVLTVRNRTVGDGTKVPIRTVAVDVYWMTKARPKGVRVGSVRTDALTPAIADGIIRRYGASPIDISPKFFPYRGTGTVLSAEV